MKRLSLAVIACLATGLAGASGVEQGARLAGAAMPFAAGAVIAVGFPAPFAVGGGGASFNFDDVTAPALPVGFVTTADGAGTLWVTQTAFADTAPNAAYSPSSPAVSNSNLDSPVIAISAGGGELSFRHRWNLETGFDGAVVEISIDGGAFADVIAAGGTFIEGGYNATMSTGFGNPIPGRAAWSGSQPAFVTTTIALPTAAADADIVVRWRQTNDSSVVATAPNGWWVDTITVGDPPPPTDPIAQITPAALSFSVPADSSATNPLTVANVGAGTLTFSITEGTPGAAASRGYQPAVSSRAAAEAARNMGPVSLGSAEDLNFVNTQKYGAGQVRPMRGRDIAVGPRGTTIDISQTATNIPEAGTGVGCGSAGNTADNSWWRRFYFDEHAGVGSTAQINTVTIGSEEGPIIPVTVNVYTIASSAAVDTIDTAQLTLIGTGTGTVGGSLALSTVAITGGLVDDTVGKDLVVEYNVQPATTGRLFPASTSSAETHPTFISSTACAITTPTTAAAIGFPEFHLVMVVNVGAGGPPTGCAAPSDVPWLNATPAAGSVLGGESTDVSVAVDTIGLAEGDYDALLCVTTNDATAALVQVPVSLEVTPAGTGDCIFANGFDDGLTSCGSGPGPGDVVYNDRASFVAAIAAGFFENPFADAVPGAMESPMVYTSGAFNYSVFTQAGAISSLYNDVGVISTNNAQDQITITFTVPVNAVGGNFWATDVAVAPTGSPVVITLSDGTIETVAVSAANTFRGFTSSTPITSLTIDAPEAVFATAPFFWATLDNLIVGVAN